MKSTQNYQINRILKLTFHVFWLHYPFIISITIWLAFGYLLHAQGKDVGQPQFITGKEFAKVYKGKRIHLEIENKDLIDALKLLAERAGISIIISDEVRGKAGDISFKDEPWDKALEIILSMHNLGAIKHGNVFSVHPLKIVQARMRQEQFQVITGMEPGNVYVGMTLSLDFKNADIHNILRLLAEVSGLNFAVSDRVKGNLTIRLVNVPWDQALNIILQTNNLGALKSGNVLQIMPLADLVAKMERLTELDKLTDQQVKEARSTDKGQAINIIQRVFGFLDKHVHSIVGILTGIAAIIGLLLKRPFSTWFTSKEKINHDKQIFGRSDKIMPEHEVIGLLDQLQENNSCHQNALVDTSNFLDFFHEEGNQYISRPLRAAIRNLVSSLSELRGFLGSDFYFEQNHDWLRIKSKDYSNRLCYHVKKIGKRYKRYRFLIKKILKV